MTNGRKDANYKSAANRADQKVVYVQARIPRFCQVRSF